MVYCEAINSYKDLPRPWLFIAGGITGGPDWQSQLVNLLEDLPGTIINPRRKNFPIDDPSAAKEQITWEFNALRDSDYISFWFIEETLCPICLYELGSHVHSNKPLFVGVHPNYKRRQDVEIQLSLTRPEVPIVYDIESLASLIKKQYR